MGSISRPAWWCWYLVCVEHDPANPRVIFFLITRLFKALSCWGRANKECKPEKKLARTKAFLPCCFFPFPFCFTRLQLLRAWNRLFYSGVMIYIISRLPGCLLVASLLAEVVKWGNFSLLENSQKCYNMLEPCNLLISVIWPWQATNESSIIGFTAMHLTAGHWLGSKIKIRTFRLG